MNMACAILDTKRNSHPQRAMAAASWPSDGGNPCRVFSRDRVCVCVCAARTRDVRLGPPSSSPHQLWPNLRMRDDARGSEPHDREILLTGFATRGNMSPPSLQLPTTTAVRTGRDQQTQMSNRALPLVPCPSARKASVAPSCGHGSRKEQSQGGRSAAVEFDESKGNSDGAGFDFFHASPEPSAELPITRLKFLACHLQI